MENKELNKKEVEMIFELAKIEVWKERIRNEECSLGEFMEAMQNGKRIYLEIN